MISYRDIVTAFQRLDVPRSRPIIVHASLSSFGDVQGGAPTIVGALLAAFDTIMAPTFTYQTMVIPAVGPLNNGLLYGTGDEDNLKAQFFRPDMPVDYRMGLVAGAVRRHPDVFRSSHPILSFGGINAKMILNAQSLAEPLAPIHELWKSDGWVLLLGVDHRSNTSIHYAERVAGRKQFTRWALTPTGVKECPRFPGCSDQFNEVVPRIRSYTRRVVLGDAWVQAISLAALVETVIDWIIKDPLALLCENCPRCQALRFLSTKA